MKNVLKYSPLGITIILLIICVLALVAENGKVDSTDYLAKNGVINLKNCNWAETPVIDLNGEWEFYPNSLKQELYLQESHLVKTVPHFWESDHDLNLSAYGFGTYRLQITGLKSSGIYGLKIPDEVTAYRLYVNDNVVASNGVVGTTKDTYSPQWRTFQGAFVADENGTAEFIMEISNFDYYRGGFWNNIKIGKLKDIFAQANAEKFLDMFLTTSILIIGCVNLFLFLLYRRRGKAMLFFSLFCFCMSMRILLTGQRLISDIFPFLNWNILVRLEYLLGYLLLPVFGLFAISLLADYPYKKILNIVFLAMIAGAFLLTLLLPNSVYSAVLEAYKWMAILYIISFIYSMFKVKIRKKQETALMLIVAGGVFAAIMKEVIIGGLMSWLPFATLNVIVCFSIITFREFLYYIKENEILGMKAFIDPLTGLFNRAYLMEMVINNDSFKQNQKKYLMFLDLDSFKGINDTFGHKIGDFVLQETAQRLKIILRNTDIVCRYGGDEFIIVVEDQENAVSIIAERIIRKIQEPFYKDGKYYHISASIGIAKVDADITNIEAVIRNSDETMYEAKRNGGSQYIFWEE